MNLDQKYPHVDDISLIPFQVIIEGMSRYPDYFGKDCPYSESVKDFFINLKARVVVEGSSDLWNDLEVESKALYEELKAFGSVLAADQTTEKMSHFRTRAQLMEKILGIIERARGLKNYSEFQNAILGVLEDELTGEQRTNVIEKLREFVK